MHSTLLGNLKDHAQTFLKISEAGNILKETYKSPQNQQLSSQLKCPFDLLAHPNTSNNPVTQKKRKAMGAVAVIPPHPPKVNPP
jgi:hypothetical protein